MQNLDVSKTVNSWSSVAETVFVPHTEAEYVEKRRKPFQALRNGAGSGQR